MNTNISAYSMAKPAKQKNQQYRMALLIFLILHVGLILELILIGHYESFWQCFPLISLGFGLLSLFINDKSLVLVKFFYLITMFSGVIGVFLHLKSNWEFELEMYPGMPTRKLLVESLSGALPALAPGTLIPIGLMGFLLLQLKPKQKIK
ncbi:MAG: hypothetical protein AAGC64_06135 [Bacteroidota bacterium]